MDCLSRGTLLAFYCIVFLIAVGNLAAERGSARIVPDWVLRTITDDELRPLPRQAQVRLPSVSLDRGTIPEVRYRTPAEYESEAGILVRWGAFNDVLTQIIVGITTGDQEAQAHIVVESQAQQARAEKTLNTAGAVMDRIFFIQYQADSPWMRDYGPRFLEILPETGQRMLSGFENDSRVMLDHEYNRFRNRDNLFPAFLSTLWGDRKLSMPLVHAGGNIHVFSDGEAFATERITRDNPGLKRWRLIAWLLSVAKLNLTVYPSFPIDFDPSGHIDMWMLPVADRQVIVGRYSSKSGLPHDITEEAAIDLSNRGYTVYRTPGWRSRGIHYTYTNALIFNHLVFVPVFEKYHKQNREALKVFEKAFPGQQIIPVECTRLLSSAGAIHCLVMHIPQISH